MKTRGRELVPKPGARTGKHMPEPTKKDAVSLGEYLKRAKDKAEKVK